jgi:arsenate reductase (thioredoxin)
MAEGLLRHLAGDRFVVMSAGTEATHVRPLAIRAMDEIGIDVSGQESKTLERYLGEPFDYVITVCDEANEACPFFPGAKNRLHWSFEDPSQAEGSEDERLAVFPPRAGEPGAHRRGQRKSQREEAPGARVGAQRHDAVRVRPEDGHAHHGVQWAALPLLRLQALTSVQEDQ